MTAFIGWTIIVAVFWLFSMALLWPAFRLIRRSHPNSWGSLWAYATAAAGCSLVLWYMIPLAVHGIFGRAAH